MAEPEVPLWSSIEGAPRGARYLDGHAAAPAREDQPISAWTYVVATPGITLSIVGYGGGLAASPSSPPGYHAIIVPGRGRGTVHYGSARFTVEPGIGVIVSPGQQPAMSFSAEAVLVVLRIDDGVLEQARASVLGFESGDAVLFRPRFDVRYGARLSFWNRVLACLQRAPHDGEATPDIGDMLASTLLGAQPYRVTPRRG
ncbi:cupin domain-containing protein [Prauserella muralis]|uniref:Transcription regulator HTH AraC- type ligand binding domain-containing protein n=1 Tax=Prauserella muralis TaxID=588067 RepID=A0A2V4AIT3_9PSEU|nr:hypothetical protein [Prauserella muralis]PXY19490.1 hypothetical protein BAY60_32645 [Prauserella muralis]TWE29468.1 AraC-like protein [Prauserella muralis]